MASDSTAGGAPADMPFDGPEPTVETLQRVVEGLQSEIAELQDKHLRALAETQNVRRRGQQDVEKERKFGIERFARDVLSVADNLGRALSALPQDVDPAVKNVISGVQATERELTSALERHGVTRIESLGKPFDANLHQAMMEIEDPSVPSGPWCRS
jgi:molecular chaperone GrpE